MSQTRETQVTIVTGAMGIGKSFQTKKLLLAYEKAHPDRNIIIFDVNEEYGDDPENPDWKGYGTLNFDIQEIQQAREHNRKNPGATLVSKTERKIRRLPRGTRRRVIPKTRYNAPMSFEQKRLTLLYLLEWVSDGLILFDDVNTYLDKWEKTEVKGMFKNVRHRRVDVVLHMQSLRPLAPVHWESVRVIRYHYDGLDVRRIREKVGELYELMKLAQLIVEEEYLRKGNKYFYVYVHTKSRKLKCSHAALSKALDVYSVTEKPSRIQEIAALGAQKKGIRTPSAQMLTQALTEWKEEKLKQYLG